MCLKLKIILEMSRNLTGNDIKLTRKRSRELAKENMGFSNAQYNTALANAKAGLRKQGLRGRELRDNAKALVTGIQVEDPKGLAVPPIQVTLNSNESVGPARSWTEAITTTGPLIETAESVANRKAIDNQIVKQLVENKKDARNGFERPTATVSLDELKEIGKGVSDTYMKDRETKETENPNNWAQYQGEFWKAMNKANAYRPYTDLAAIQNWMWDDYNRNWKPYDNAHPNYRWHLPTEAELAPYKNLTGVPAGTLTGPMGTWYEQGYNPNVNYFDFTNAKYGELGGSKKAYNQGAAATGAMMLTPVVAGIASDVIAGGLPETTGYNPVGIQMKRPGVMGQTRLPNGQFGLNKQGSWYMDIFNGKRVPGWRVGGFRFGGKLVKNLK